MAATALEIHTRTPVLDGQPFGQAGAYEKITGVLRFAADPDDPRHRAITDLGAAPRNARGQVEFAGDFYLLKPLGRGNGRLLLDVPNRGRKIALGLFNSTPRVPDPTTAQDFGNGFLLRHGYTVAWIGWQHDVPRQDGLMALDVPRVPGVSGLVRCEFRPNVRADVLPMADRYHIPHPTVDVNDPEARLTVRDHAGAPDAAVPRSAWRFTDRSHVGLTGGFEPGKIYDLVYRSADPPLVGLGFLAVRDTAAFLRWATTGNPCAGTLERAYVFGVSQTGRFLRHLLALGLDEDEAGRLVFDAVFPHVAGARRGEFNTRFGQPSLNAQHAVGSLFPFTHDAAARCADRRARRSLEDRVNGGAQPKIFETNSSAEYWRGDASLAHTDTEGKTDVTPPANVRLYLFAGTQHLPGIAATAGRRSQHGRPGTRAVQRRGLCSAPARGAGEPRSLGQRGRGASAQRRPTAGRRHGGAPRDDGAGLSAPCRGCASPTVSCGRAGSTSAPTPRAVSSPSCRPRSARRIRRSWRRSIVTATRRRASVPVELRVPLGTFTGWNPRHPDQGAPGDIMAMMGSTLPFARTREERERAGDPRPSVGERYPSRADYLARIRAAAEELVG